MMIPRRTSAHGSVGINVKSRQQACLRTLTSCPSPDQPSLMSPRTSRRTSYPSHALRDAQRRGSLLSASRNFISRPFRHKVQGGEVGGERTIKQVRTLVLFLLESFLEADSYLSFTALYRPLPHPAVALRVSILKLIQNASK